MNGNAILVLQIIVSVVYIGRNSVKNLQFRSMCVQEQFYIIILPCTQIRVLIELCRM